VKYDIEEAVNILGVSKKTIDDYMMLIKMGRRYGFEFNSHINEGLGTLRNFIRHQKQQERENESMDKGDKKYYMKMTRWQKVMNPVAPTETEEDINRNEEVKVDEILNLMEDQ